MFEFENMTEIIYKSLAPVPLYAFVLKSARGGQVVLRYLSVARQV